MNKKTCKIIAALMILVTLSSLPVYITAAEETVDGYYSQLIGMGFPEDYAEKLYELHLLHPTWSFEPLKVTALNPRYTWDHVIYMETEASENRSLISSSENFRAYRHATNTKLYDSGWYQASEEAVAYFMDPRNFLNEKDIFQFENLSFSDNITVKQVESSLEGTFMENTVLENGRTYAEYFFQLGKTLGISPLHLASRARQEQGLGTSSQINGNGGDKLWYYYKNKIQTEGDTIVCAPSSGHTEQELKGYNGLYNFFNINASGTGTFAILLGALKRAKEGTASMAEEWGGSPSWDTLWKSIYGGADKLANSYIKNYQNTLYLQKWNVDARSKSSSGGSRNFWGQYMQNVGAALTEARNNYDSFSANGCLDCTFNFLIPVYEGMPSECPDPAEGKCEFYEQSDKKYSYINKLDQCEETREDTFFEIPLTAYRTSEPLDISGFSLHSRTPEAFEISVDYGAWTEIKSSHIPSPLLSEPEYKACANPAVPNSFDCDFPVSALSLGEHTVLIRGRVASDIMDKSLNNCRYYLIAKINLSVILPVVNVEINDINGLRTEKAAVGETYILPQASKSKQENTYFSGWQVSMTGKSLFLPAQSEIDVSGDISLKPVYIELGMIKGASAKIAEESGLRFAAYLGHDGYNNLCLAAGENNVETGMIICKTPSSGLITVHPDSLTLSSVPYMKTIASHWFNEAQEGGYYGFAGESIPVKPGEYDTLFSATAYVHITYSDGKTKYICADYDASSSCRSVNNVAAQALISDTHRNYSGHDLSLLRTLAE